MAGSRLLFEGHPNIQRLNDMVRAIELSLDSAGQGDDITEVEWHLTNFSNMLNDLETSDYSPRELDKLDASIADMLQSFLDASDLELVTKGTRHPYLIARDVYAAWKLDIEGKLN